MLLISGGLGSGKTTLIQRLLDHADCRVAVLMNEFGEVNIDGRLLRDRQVETREAITVVELTGGCVCCELRGEFEAAVEETVASVKPDLIVVETTGLAEPEAVVLDVEDELPSIRLEAVIAVADADALVRFPDLGGIARAQLAEADLVLVNKCDLVDEEELGRVEAAVDRLSGGAPRLRTIRCDVEPDLLFGAPSAPASGRHSGASAHAHFEVETFTYRSARILDADALRRALVVLPESVYRAKGPVVTTEGGRWLSYVGGRWSLDPGDVSETVLVFIGVGLLAARASIDATLSGCERSTL